MKKSILLKSFMLVIMFSLLWSAGCSSSGAAAYNDKLIGYQSRVINKMIEFSTVSQKGDDVATSRALSDLETMIDKTLKELAAEPGFEGDTSLRDVIIELIEFYQGLAANQYKELVSISRGRTTLSEADQNYVQRLLQEIDDSEKVIDKKVQEIQQEFARKHNIQIKANPMQRQIDNIE